MDLKKFLRTYDAKRTLCIKTGTSLIMGKKIKQITVKLAGGGLATWTFQQDLIMLQTDSTSAQWNPNTIDVELSLQEIDVKVGMYPSDDTNYQNWYFETDSYIKLLSFFQSLGFSCGQPDRNGDVS